MEKYLPNTVVMLPLDNYIATIKGSIGSEMFRHLYATVNGVRKDITNDGLVSCAFFVSSILSMPNFKLLPTQHAGVAGMIRALEASGWVKTDHVAVPGEVIVWEKAQQAGGEAHMHAGFFVGDNKAVSHVDSTRTPQEHHLTFGVNEDATSKRKLIAVYTHKFLG